MPTKKITIEGMAIPKGRPRSVLKGKYVHTYTPKRTRDFEKLVKETYLAKYSLSDMIKKPYGVSINLHVHKQIPKGFTKKKTAEILNGNIQLITKPDMDNVEKSIYDALNQVAYEDDAQICKCNWVKSYCSGASFTELEIEKI